MADNSKSSRLRFVRIAIWGIVLSLLVFIALMARSLILPTFTAFMLAYLFKPLIYTASLKGISRTVSATTIVLGLFTLLTIGFKLIEKAMPTGVERLEKQVRVQYQLNEHASNIFNVKSGDKNQGSLAYKYFHTEIDGIMEFINSTLTPTTTETENLEILLKARDDDSGKLLLSMLNSNKSRPYWIPSTTQSLGLSDQMPHLSITQVAVWLVFPIVFFFLLIDDGSVLRFFVRLIPNSYFELTLTLMERVDRALGRYLRGAALECTAVGFVTGLILFLFGMNLTGAVVVGIIAGILNIIPFLGTFAGLVAGVVYAITQEEALPLLPYLTKDHLIIGVFVAVGVAHFLDNAVFQPLLVGRAVNLHPLAVILTVATSGMAFGFIGMLLAIPTIVTLKVCFETISSGLRDYNLI